MTAFGFPSFSAWIASEAVFALLRVTDYESWSKSEAYISSRNPWSEVEIRRIVGRLAEAIVLKTLKMWEALWL
jgi:hypothetical protein